MKKVLSLILALTMVLALAVPAFATDVTVTDFSKGATSTMNSVPYSPTISVTVPSTSTVILNPYKLDVDLTKYGGTGSDTSKKEIISPVQHMGSASTSECTLAVGATVTGTPATGVTLLAEAPADWEGNTKNAAYLEFGMAAAADNTGTSVTPTIKTPVTAKAAVATDDGTPEGTTKTVDLEAGKYVDFVITGNVNPTPAVVWSSKMTVKVAIAFTFTPKA